MSILRIFAIALIFLLCWVGWVILGTTTQIRSGHSQAYLGAQVMQLWGQPIRQQAPNFSLRIPGTQQIRPVLPESNHLEVDLRLDYRRKGLIWYPTYACDFKGQYEVTNHEEVRQKVRVHFPFPVEKATYDRFAVYLDQALLDVPVDTKEGIHWIIELEPGQTRTFSVQYRSRGLREWRYDFGAETGRVRNLDALIKTDFHAIDFVQQGLSPMQQKTTKEGMHLSWKAKDLITTQHIGIRMPERLNPGPLSTRITFFAPVCLLFFFVLIGTIGILYKVLIHPMHYLFIAAGFFAFHLLFAYLVDLIPIHLAFWVSAMTSITLVTGYLATALGTSFPWKLAAIGQIFYLVLFSYSFFLEGITGLTVTIGSVLTLAVLMRVTAKTDWNKVFRSKKHDGTVAPA